MGLCRACTEERATFCEDLVPGNARIFRCLVNNIWETDLADVCRNVVFGTHVSMLMPSVRFCMVHL
jgi:hypothetical protein